MWVGRPQQQRLTDPVGSLYDDRAKKETRSGLAGARQVFAYADAWARKQSRGDDVTLTFLRRWRRWWLAITSSAGGCDCISRCGSAPEAVTKGRTFPGVRTPQGPTDDELFLPPRAATGD